MKHRLTIVTLFVSVVVGIVAGLGSVSGPQSVVYAEPCGSMTVFDCSTEQNTGANAFLKVLHKAQNGTNVQPNTGESWKITARYATPNSGYCPCESSLQTEFEATLDVDLGIMGFATSNLVGTTTAPFNSVAICNQGLNCADNNDGFNYKLKVNLDKTIQMPCAGHGDEAAILYQVLFETTAVDNAVSCGGANVHTATTQTFQTADNGQYECNTDAGCPTTKIGAQITIQYNN